MATKRVLLIQINFQDKAVADKEDKKLEISIIKEK